MWVLPLSAIGEGVLFQNKSRLWIPLGKGSCRDGQFLREAAKRRKSERPADYDSMKASMGKNMNS